MQEKNLFYRNNIDYNRGFSIIDINELEEGNNIIKKAVNLCQLITWR